MTFIDFFSGIGGFRIGLEMAGHKCVGFCECDKYAVKSYRAMFDTEGEWYCGDIRTAEPSDLPEADIYCGGFPCQAFSVAGKRRGFEDMRGTLVFEIFRLAAERKPRILFLENVAGLLNHESGRTFGTILSGLWELGYDVQWQVLNSKNFGVPQNRERVFIIGHSGTGPRPEVFPIIETNEQVIKQLVGGSQGYRVYDPNGLSTTLASEAGELGAKTGLYLVGKDGKEKQKDYASCLTGGGHSGGNHSDMDLIVQPVLTPDRAEKRQNGRRFKEDGEPMFTLTGQDRHGVMIKDRIDVIGNVYGTEGQAGKCYTQNGLSPSIQGQRVNSQGYMMISGIYTQTSDDHQRGPLPGLSRSLKAQTHDAGITDGARIRRLTPLECWRLQGFPDEYFYKAKAAGISDSQLYRQAGNSVTVNVIYEIAKRLQEASI